MTWISGAAAPISGGGYVTTFLEAPSWRAHICCCYVLLLLSGWWMSGQRPRADDACASRRRPREPWLAAASWGVAVAWLGFGDILESLGWWVCRPGRRVSAETVWLLGRGGGPGYWCGGRGLRAVNPVQLGLRLSRAASWLKCERWQVSMAIPEGGVGDSHGVAQQLDVGVAAPKHWQCWGHRPCVVRTTRLPLMLVIGVPLAQLLGWLASSSAFERPVSAPPIVVAASSLWCWRMVIRSCRSGVLSCSRVLCGLGSVVGVGVAPRVLFYGFRSVFH
jgi:hypothetical protein